LGISEGCKPFELQILDLILWWENIGWFQDEVTFSHFKELTGEQERQAFKKKNKKFL
jgi:hypothetical protein